MLRNRRKIRRHGRVRGFTLIEVLVAFAILAISLTVLMRTFSAGLDAIGSSERYATATLLARSTLEQVGVTIPVTPGEIARDAGDGFRIILRITPAANALPVSTSRGLISPYEATATVQWLGGSLTLTTLHLAMESADTADPRRARSAAQADRPFR